MTSLRRSVSYGVLTIIDPFWRFSPAMESLLTFRGPDVVKSTVGLLKKPGDKCTEFVSRDLDP